MNRDTTDAVRQMFGLADDEQIKDVLPDLYHALQDYELMTDHLIGSVSLSISDIAKLANGLPRKVLQRFETTRPGHRLIYLGYGDGKEPNVEFIRFGPCGWLVCKVGQEEREMLLNPSQIARQSETKKALEKEARTKAA